MNSLVTDDKHVEGLEEVSVEAEEGVDAKVEVVEVGQGEEGPEEAVVVTTMV